MDCPPVTGRKTEALALIAFAQETLRLDTPQTLTALARACAIVLDVLPDEGRQLGVDAVFAMLKDRGIC